MLIYPQRRNEFDALKQAVFPLHLKKDFRVVFAPNIENMQDPAYCNHIFSQTESIITKADELIDNFEEKPALALQHALEFDAKLKFIPEGDCHVKRMIRHKRDDCEIKKALIFTVCHYWDRGQDPAVQNYLEKDLIPQIKVMEYNIQAMEKTLATKGIHDRVRYAPYKYGRN